MSTDRRRFSEAEKLVVIKKVLEEGLPINKVKDEKGRPIHYGVVNNWIRRYQLEGTIARPPVVKNKIKTPFTNTQEKAATSMPPFPKEFQQYSPKIPQSASAADLMELWKYIFMLWKYIFEIQAENDQLKTKVNSPKGTDRRRSNLMDHLAPLMNKLGENS
jgi:transposase-like protein